MFLGEDIHSLDAKGRLTIPARYRTTLSSGLVVAKGEDYCLQVYALDAWEEKLEEVRRRGDATREDREYRRAVFSGAEEGALDAQGRLLIKEKQRSYAGMTKDVAVIGNGDFLELWATESWEEEEERVDRAIGERNEVDRPRTGDR